MTTDRGAVGMIVFANAAALGIAWWEQWSMLLLLMPYWVQNVVIFMLIFIQTGKIPGNLPVPEITATDAAWITVLSGVFALTQRASFKRNFEHDRKGCPTSAPSCFCLTRAWFPCTSPSSSACPWASPERCCSSARSRPRPTF